MRSAIQSPRTPLIGCNLSQALRSYFLQGDRFVVTSATGAVIQDLYVRFSNIDRINVGTRVLFAGKPFTLKPAYCFCCTL